ncbi:MAG: peptide-methionine (R)-S-oxide reductase [Rhodospirillaceae bacterium TMED8]|nr:peptide-methionine (R)-S-oxide reductase [Magnetovibrio sp.]OUT53206.1 MAG: peptide-methionine (R)-S-oxide reductase [Rhodospirillaceae bacterium TMED8]
MDMIIKTETEWREQLTAEQFRVCRQKGTERAYTGKYDKCTARGTYVCVCCGNPLFDSETKFDSGTGWPSFYSSIDKNAVIEEVDDSFFMRRTEVICAKCGSHLGHVFPDGPDPTGLRYCMNSASLDLLPPHGS